MLHGQQPLDFSYLIQMVGNDPVFLIDFFETFILQNALYLAEINETLIKEDWAKLASCAHKIKPTFSYIGRNDVKELVQTIEYNAKNMTALNKIPKDVERLNTLSLKICEQLEEAKKDIQSKI